MRLVEDHPKPTLHRTWRSSTTTSPESCFVGGVCLAGNEQDLDSKHSSSGWLSTLRWPPIPRTIALSRGLVSNRHLMQRQGSDRTARHATPSPFYLHLDPLSAAEGLRGCGTAPPVRSTCRPEDRRKRKRDPPADVRHVAFCKPPFRLHSISCGMPRSRLASSMTAHVRYLDSETRARARLSAFLSLRFDASRSSC